MIHYHGISGAGGAKEVVPFVKGRHCFVSFAMPRALPMIASICSSFALDNGAFTAWKNGVPFEWDGLIEFVKDWMSHPAFDFVVIPDVIDGSEKENDELIERWDFPDFMSVPVFHFHESLSRLESLIERFSYIAFGSSGDFATPNSKEWWVRMNEIMEVATDKEGKARARFHGLRMLDPRIFSRLPLRSADSTNAERNGLFVDRFGIYPSPTRGQRCVVIADRVEAHQSSAGWYDEEKSTDIFTPSFCQDEFTF